MREDYCLRRKEDRGMREGLWDCGKGKFIVVGSGGCRDSIYKFRCTGKNGPFSVLGRGRSGDGKGVRVKGLGVKE